MILQDVMKDTTTVLKAESRVRILTRKPVPVSSDEPAAASREIFEPLLRAFGILLARVDLENLEPTKGKFKVYHRLELKGERHKRGVTRKVLNFKIWLRVVLTARRRY